MQRESVLPADDLFLTVYAEFCTAAKTAPAPPRPVTTASAAISDQIITSLKVPETVTTAPAHRPVEAAGASSTAVSIVKTKHQGLQRKRPETTPGETEKRWNPGSVPM